MSCYRNDVPLFRAFDFAELDRFLMPLITPYATFRIVIVFFSILLWFCIPHGSFRTTSFRISPILAPIRSVHHIIQFFHSSSHSLVFIMHLSFFRLPYARAFAP